MPQSSCLVERPRISRSCAADLRRVCPRHREAGNHAFQGRRGKDWNELRNSESSTNVYWIIGTLKQSTELVSVNVLAEPCGQGTRGPRINLAGLRVRLAIRPGFHLAHETLAKRSV